MFDKVLTTLGYFKKMEELMQLLSYKHLTAVWNDIQLATPHRGSDKQRTPALARLKILRKNLYQIRERAWIVDVLLTERTLNPTPTVVPSELLPPGPWTGSGG